MNVPDRRAAGPPPAARRVGKSTAAIFASVSAGLGGTAWRSAEHAGGFEADMPACRRRQVASGLLEFVGST
jgi:hypothetical protein